MAKKAKYRQKVIRDECLNCDHLFGSVFAPGCKVGEYVGDIDAKEWCRGYKAISAIGDKEIRERKGETK